MSKHTPGPWEKSKKRDGTRVVLSSGRVIRAKVHGPLTVGSPGYDEAEANARLIAAAPDLLEAAKAALRGLEHAAHFANTWQDDGHPIFEASYQRRMDALRAAIARAEGAEK